MSKSTLFGREKGFVCDVPTCHECIETNISGYRDGEKYTTYIKLCPCNEYKGFVSYPGCSDRGEFYNRCVAGGERWKKISPGGSSDNLPIMPNEIIVCM